MHVAIVNEAQEWGFFLFLRKYCCYFRDRVLCVGVEWKREIKV